MAPVSRPTWMPAGLGWLIALLVLIIAVIGLVFPGLGDALGPRFLLVLIALLALAILVP